MVADALLKDRTNDRVLLSIFKSFQVMLTIMHTFIRKVGIWRRCAMQTHSPTVSLAFIP